MINWRFDQGRLDYFQFDEIKKIAQALTTLNGISKPRSSSPDILRATLSQFSGLHFAPYDYYVWRNYKRVFGCQLLAAEIGERIYATELCKKLATDAEDLDVDDYLGHVAKNFYYPSPVFEGYTTTGRQIFPIVALIKFLVSEGLIKGKSSISLKEVVQYLIGNQVTGLEPLDTYAKLRKTDLMLSGDQPRQLRELLRFISQFSFLKWKNPSLYLEVSSKEELFGIENSVQPTLNTRSTDPGDEIIRMGSGYKQGALGGLTIKQFEMLDQEFTEGKKIRVTHLRTERSSKLKQLYFSSSKHPEICNMCSVDTARRYPWTPHVIELHHLLPLASPVRVETGTTSLKDLVGLCPSCHRATHKYYGSWLQNHGQKDFRDYAEAKAIFTEVKTKIVLN